MQPSRGKAVLLTGVYGSGKTAVVEEIASLLEERGMAYAALDLDWLGWFDAGWDDDAEEHRMMLKNLHDVVGNYLAADIGLFVLALSIETQPELDAIRAALPMPLKVVLLTVPLETIRERLGSDTTTGRQHRETGRSALGSCMAERGQRHRARGLRGSQRPAHP